MSVTNDFLNEEMQPSFFKQLTIIDWIFAALLVVGSVYAFQKYSDLMDAYEVGILFATAITFIGIGWIWKPSGMLADISTRRTRIICTTVPSCWTAFRRIILYCFRRIMSKIVIRSITAV